MNLTNLSDAELLELEAELDNECRNLSFAKWVLYNVRDVEGLEHLENKFKFIPLVNQMAHENAVLYDSIKGTVRYVETGMTLRAHQVHNLIVPDKGEFTENEKVEGAIVMTPKLGRHEWVGSVDITSLYPSAIRSLNMSIETFMGQFELEEQAWRRIMMIEGDQEAELHCTMKEGDVISGPPSEWRELLVANKWALSGFGTIFRCDKPGIVADTLTFWFAERKRLQAEKKRWGKEADRLKAETGVEIPAELLKELA
jgi:DNA polymerase elongation subunit (family B)